MSSAFADILGDEPSEPTPRYEEDGIQLYCNDATDVLPHVDDVALTVTSPPYLDAIDYDEHDGDYTERDSQQIEKWRAVQQSVFSSLYDATRDGGYCAVVIGDVVDQNDSYRPLTAHFATMMEQIGWNYHENITWAKPTGGSSRFGTLIQHPHPTYYYPNRQSEQIQIWAKGDNRTEKQEEHTIEITDVLKKEVANDVWHIPPVPHNRDDINHPCPFPTEIVDRLVRLYSYPDERVCDPMMGSGTTPHVASSLGRDVLGIDLREEYVDNAVERVESEYERGDVVVPQYPTEQP
jgi:site-specific DNA-methyltransferase (adenine-specific)